MRLLDAAQAAYDRKSLASLHSNSGHTSVEIGDFEAAEKHLSLAIAIFADLGEPLRVARAQLARGRMLVRRGEADRGIAHLRTTRDQFIRHGLVEEAELCAHVVEALLSREAAREASPAKAAGVRQYIDSLRTEPDRVFTASA